MRKRHHYIFWIIFLFAATSVLAQEGEVTVDPGNGNGSFSPVTSSGPVTIKKVEEETISDLKNNDAYWYANVEPEKKAEPNRSGANNKEVAIAGWFSNLLWIIIVVSFIAIVVWYLISSNVQLFQKTSKAIINEEEEEEAVEDIFLMNYDKEIAKAVKAENYRLAIRLWYLYTLKELAQRNVIDYRHEKTNSDYVNALSGSSYYRDFFRLTRNFEYTWYGQFPLTEEGYKFLQRDFSSFKNNLH